MSRSINAAHLQAYNDALRLPPAELVDALRTVLGARLVAYIAGVDGTAMIRDWAAGVTSPPAAAMTRLRTAYRVVRVLTHEASPGMAASWLQGTHPDLDDRSPARILRDDTDDAQERVLRAALAFAAG